MQEVKLVSGRQEVLAGLADDKSRLQSKATYFETTFEEMRELGEQKSKEALILIQNKHVVSRCQSGRDGARMLQRLGVSRAPRHWTVVRDTMSVDSCSSSMAFDMEGRSVLGVFRGR